MSMKIGVDIGGTHILAVLMNAEDPAVTRRAHKVVFAEKRKDQQYVIDLIVEAITELLSSDTDSLKKLDGIGFAVPGNVDPSNGQTRYLPNFGWLEPVDLKALVLAGLPKAYKDTKVEMRNDGRCAALAEYKYGRGKGRNDSVFSMLTLGTGIGGAVLINGNLFDGSSFDAGDFGHHVISSGKDAFECVCGKVGCFETHASAAGLVRHYNHIIPNNSASWHALSLDDARSVVDAFQDESPVEKPTSRDLAKKAFQNWLGDLSNGLANLITFYNPSCIVLGGGMSKFEDLLQELPQLGRDSLQAEVDKLTLPATRGRCAILTSSLGDDAGAVGAALLIQ